MEPARFPGIGVEARSIRESIASRGVRRWLLGGCLGLVWLVNTAFDVYGTEPEPASRAAFTAVAVVYGLAFLAIPPVNWALPVRHRLYLPAALWALSFAFVPWLGWQVFDVWAYVGVAAAISLAPFRAVLAFVAALTFVTAVLAWRAGLDGDSVFYVPAIIASVSLMMAALGRMIAGMNQLRATQHELAHLAVEQERSRLARDLHDILGHSLTVITVKAELAGRLVASDPDAAMREIAEVEGLARGALADVRTTVSGHRGVSIAAELANARTALDAAGIEADLPGSVDSVPASRRELFGWVVREGVTNVVRHSRATHCTVELGAAFVEVTDDGTGPAETSPGTGLAGLRERVLAAGLQMSAGALPGGGFRLRVSE